MHIYERTHTQLSKRQRQILFPILLCAVCVYVRVYIYAAHICPKAGTFVFRSPRGGVIRKSKKLLCPPPSAIEEPQVEGGGGWDVVVLKDHTK